MNILFVCTGNTCRSPMAQAIACNIAGCGVTISSAGLSAWDGSPASPHAVRWAQARGLSLENHRARTLTQDMVNENDLILTMTKAHKEYLLKAFRGAADKTYTISEYGGEKNDISDPYNLDYAAYEQCAGELTRLLRAVSVKWK